MDLGAVCCLCGDIGFPDKLFRCNKCHNRFQHSYCSSSYRESSEAIEECEWCQSEARNSQHAAAAGGSSKKKMGRNDSGLAIPKYNNNNNNNNNNNSGDQSNDHKAGKSPSPSPRTATRRYKLLKDVMC